MPFSSKVIHKRFADTYFLGASYIDISLVDLLFGLVLFSLFLNSSLFRSIFNLLLSFTKLFFQFVLFGYFATDPRMLSYLDYGRPLRWVVGDHFLDEVLELRAVIVLGLFLFIFTPKFIILFLYYQTIKDIQIVWKAKWWSSRIQNEQNYSSSKYIRFLSVVVFLINLRSHVSWSA